MKYKKIMIGILVINIIILQFLSCHSTKTTDNINEFDEAEKPLKFSMSMSTSENRYCLGVSDINKDKWVLELNKRANIELDLRLFDHDKFPEQMRIMFASGDIPDVVWTFGDWKDTRLNGTVEAEVFLPLDDLLWDNKDKLTNLIKTIPQQAWKESKTDFNGRIYNIPVGYLSEPALNGTFIRKDLLDKYGIKAPKTLDEAVNVLRTFKIWGMQYPYTGREKWAYTTTFLEPFGVAINRWNFNSKGELVPDIIRPEMKEALSFHAMLVKEGLMDPDFLITNGYSWTNKIYSGKKGAIFTHQVQGLPEWNNGIKSNVTDGKFELIPAIEGPKGAKGSTISPTIWSSVFINRNFKEPLKFLQFLDWATTPEAEEFFNFGIEGEDYIKKDGIIQFASSTDIKKISENQFRGMLKIVIDQSYNKSILPFISGGNEIENFFQKISPQEGYHAYKTDVTMKALKVHPELNPENCPLFFEYASKIVLGKLSVDAFDNFVAEYLKLGGAELIKEQNERYKQKKIEIY